VTEREEKKEEQAEAKPAESSPRKSFLAGLFSQPMFIYVVIGVLALIVIGLLFKRKETPSQPSVSVVQPQQPVSQPVSQPANPVKNMIDEINSMFGAELWRP
jgi:cytoskeletal protein RodZ